MTELQLFARFGAALAIGFLIGLQREFASGPRNQEIIAGERTFALMGVVGALAAMAADHVKYGCQGYHCTHGRVGSLA